MLMSTGIKYSLGKTVNFQILKNRRKVVLVISVPCNDSVDFKHFLLKTKKKIFWLVVYIHFAADQSISYYNKLNNAYTRMSSYFE
jgi:hypothetical protein